MVYIAPFIAAAGFFSFASALPRPDSSINEPAVSAPDGTPITETAGQAAATSVSVATSTQAASESQMTAAASTNTADSGYGWNSDSGSSSSSWESAATTTSAWNAYSTPSYGSGSSNWGGSSGGSGYNDCVNQCMASYGSPMAAYTPPPSMKENSGSSGSGTTHTVIVAPVMGVLRYVPFAVNASVGDTVMFMWGANNHTVTKSDALTVCDKATDALFTSGTQNKDFTFTQVVNDTNPVFFHCGTPGHCQKGMFGIINPPNAIGSPTSVSGMMSSLTSNNSDISAYASVSSKMCAGNSVASKWGGGIDMGKLPDWSHQYVAENVLYTRNFLASNKDVTRDDGSVDLSSAATNPLMFPQDISTALNNAGSSSAATSASAAASGSSTASASSSAASSSSTAASSTNGANSLTSSTAMGLVAALAVFLAL